MAEPIPAPSLEVRCPACHTLLLQVEGSFTRLLGGAVKIECRRCGKRTWLNPPTKERRRTKLLRYNSV